MAQTNPFTQFFSESNFTKALSQYQGIPVDMKSLMETQRKNWQALGEAQQLAVANMQAIAQRQSEIMSQIAEDNSSIAKEFVSEGTPEEKIAKNAELFKRFYERTIKNAQELSTMISKSNTEASNVISKRVSASMNEIKEAFEKEQDKAA